MEWPTPSLHITLIPCHLVLPVVAPELIRGDEYSELVDIFSFGVVMWEFVARRQPYSGRNFMGVCLEVLEGKRPQAPPDCPEAYSKIMRQCWHAQAAKRPSMKRLIHFLDQELGDDPAGPSLGPV